MGPSIARRVRRVLGALRRARELGPRGITIQARDALLKRFPDLRLARTALVVRERSGKSVAAQVREVIGLRWGPGTVRPRDYYAYELYDDGRYSLAEKQEFVSWPPERLSDKLNDAHWREVCDDKLLTYAVLRRLCLPHPEVYAVFHPGSRTYGPVPCLHTAEDMADFLRRGMTYPFFGKPVKNSFGRGASSVDAIDGARDVLLLQDGSAMGVDEYVRHVALAHAARQHAWRFRSSYDSGYLFQERVVPHPIVDRLTGGRAHSLRLVALVWSDGPRVFRASWKVATGTNVTDHLRFARNVGCPVDRTTGRVEGMVRSRGLADTPIYGLGHEGTSIEVHPDTGHRLTGVQLPDWDRIITLCLNAAAAFPGLRYQAWDLVLSADGPTILELNFNGGISQFPGWRGLNDAEFRQFMRGVEAGT
jgi:hypothetical protein